MATNTTGQSKLLHRHPQYGHVVVGLIWAVLTLCLLAPTAVAEEKPADNERSIFQRFALRRDPPKLYQTVYEFPVLLRPQTQPDSETEYNLGINWISAVRPMGRFYASRSIGLAMVDWRPPDPAIEKVKVKTADFSMLLNVRSTEWLVTSFGLGLGLMDGLIYFNDERVFDPRLEPFLPLHFGLAARMGETWQVGLKLTQSSFFRSKPVISFARVLLGIGYSY